MAGAKKGFRRMPAKFSAGVKAGKRAGSRGVVSLRARISSHPFVTGSNGGKASAPGGSGGHG
jgi:hypothetical protein